MRQSSKIFVTILLVLFSICTTASPARAGNGRVHGVVADESGGVLPGVTVVAAAEDGRVLATGITDEVGRYALSALPATSVRLTFQIEGFSHIAVDVNVSADADATVATQRLKLAPKSEIVEVRGEARMSAPAPPPPPRAVVPPPPPRRLLKAIPDHDRDSVCGPSKPGGTADSLGTIRSGPSARGNGLYAAGDELVIDGGTATSLEVGQNVVARRSYRTSADPEGRDGEHTAGLIQIVAVDQNTAAAVVVYACDELLAGDWLARFTPEPFHAPEPAGLPVYDHAARIVLTDAGQMVGAPRRLMVIDQGTDNGVRVGQRLTLFRLPRPGARGPAVIGDAVVVAVRIDSATIRVQHAKDIIAIGDSAAPQR
jgi:hypothetical protein